MQPVCLPRDVATHAHLFPSCAMQVDIRRRMAREAMEENQRLVYLR